MIRSKKIIDSILSINFFGIREVIDLENIKTVEYTWENRQMLTEILRNGQYEKVELFEPVKELFVENLAVYRFRDEKGRVFHTLLYEAGLGMETMAIEIFPVID